MEDLLHRSKPLVFRSPFSIHYLLDQPSDLNLRASLVIIKCTSKYNNNYVPAAIKLFEAKVLNLMLNETQLCIYENTSNLETI